MWFFYLKFFLVEILPLESKTFNCLTFHNLYQEGCLCQTITSKRIKLKIPAWSGFDGLEKFFPTVMQFLYLNFFLVEISPLEAETYYCLTLHNLYQEVCLYRAVTSKQIKLKIPAWSGFNGLEKLFPTVMWFFYLNFFLVEIWLTLATWSKSTISNQWAVTSGKKGMVGHMFQSFLELV